MKYILIGLLMALSVSTANAHDRYTEWERPDTGGSCCSEKDCRITLAYWDAAKKQWMAMFKGRYIPIPPEKILDQTVLKDYDGNAHLCADDDEGEPNGVHIYCFAAPEAKY